MKLLAKIIVSTLSVIALPGLLVGCDKKASDTAATPAANDTAAATSGADDANERNRTYGPGMSDDMAERHRQEMDHDSMRRSAPMGPGGMPAGNESQAAPPKQDM